MRARIVLLVLAAASALLLLAACGGGGRPDASTPTPFVAEGTTYRHGCPSGGIAPRVIVNEELSVNAVPTWLAKQTEPLRISQGRPVAMTLAIANCSNVPLKANYPTSQRYDFSVEDKYGHEVWRWSRGKLFLQVESEEAVESVQYTEVWDQRDRDGDQVSPGPYTVRARTVGTVKFPPDASRQLGCEPTCGGPRFYIEITP